jgi:hypothetical protein
MMNRKLESPSAERNKGPIWDVLQSRIFPSDRSAPFLILEVAAGAGVHTQFFCRHLLDSGKLSFRWYPTDPEDSSKQSIQAHTDEVPGLSEKVESPTSLTLDADGIMEPETEAKLKDMEFDLIININMIHISPWEATLGLMKLAGEKLVNGGALFLYGPYKVGGTAVESNL